MKTAKKIILRPTMASQDIYKIVSANIKKAQISLRDLSTAAKVSRMTLWSWQQGQQEPSLDSLVRLCKGLNKLGIPAEIKL